MADNIEISRFESHSYVGSLSNLFTFDDGYSYRLHEKTAPEGYAIKHDYSFAIVGEKTQKTIEDKGETFKLYSSPYWFYTNNDVVVIEEDPSSTWVKVEKSWEGISPSEMPESITVKLLDKADRFADNSTGTVVETQVLTSANANSDGKWVYTFDNLPQLAEGHSYVIQEEPVAGMSVTYSDNNGIGLTNSGTITMTNKKTAFTVKKVFEGGDPSQNLEVTVNLKDGSDTVATGILKYDSDPDKAWTYTFTGLEDKEYTVEEVPVKGYVFEKVEYSNEDKSTSGLKSGGTATITNKKQVVKVKKEWSGNQVPDGLTGIRVKLYKLNESGKKASTPTATATLNASGNWEHVFDNLEWPAHYIVEEDSGYNYKLDSIQYTTSIWRENWNNYDTQSADYLSGSADATHMDTATITNSKIDVNPENTVITAEKKWLNSDGTEMTAAQIAQYESQNDTELVSEVKLQRMRTEKNGVTVKFAVFNNNWDGLVFLNYSYIAETGKDIGVSYSVSGDSNSKDNLSGIKVIKSAEEIWTNAPIFLKSEYADRDTSYVIPASSLNGVSEIIVVLNNYNSADKITSVDITNKVTGDSNAPTADTAFNNIQSPVTISSSSGWKHIWANSDTTTYPDSGEADGKLWDYTYYVEEISVPGFTTTYKVGETTYDTASEAAISGGTITISNMEDDSDFTSVTASKTWAPAKEDAQVALTLLNNGEAVTTTQLQEWGSTVTENPKTITRDGSVTWDHLPKEGKYTVSETVAGNASGYTSYVMNSEGKYVKVAAGDTPVSAVVNHQAGFVNFKESNTNIPFTKTWADFTSDEYTWSATFLLEYIETKVSGDGPDQSTDKWQYFDPEHPITIDKSGNSDHGTTQFTSVPKYRIDENGNVYLRQYSVEEQSFEVKRADGTLLYAFNRQANPQYTFGSGVDEKQYRPFFDHDANEDNDGNWNIDLSNSVGREIEKRYSDIKLSKVWRNSQGATSTPDGAKATFTLHRYVAEEYRDISRVKNNPVIEVILLDSAGNPMQSLQTYSGSTIYLDTTFGAGKIGSIVASCNGKELNATNGTLSNNKVIQRSNGIVVTGSEGDKVYVQLRTSDFSSLADGRNGVRITDRMASTGLREDSTYTPIQFTLDGNTDTTETEAWKAVFSHLLMEDGSLNSDGTQETYYIYSYYFTEDSITPENYTGVFTDSNRNVVNKDNRIYADGNITATNTETADHYHIEKRWYRLNSSEQPPIVIKAGVYKNNYNNSDLQYQINQTGYSDSGVAVEPQNIGDYQNVYILNESNDWNVNFYGLEGVGGEKKVFVEEVGLLINGTIVSMKDLQGDGKYFRENHYLNPDSNGLVGDKTPEWWEQNNIRDYRGMINSNPQGNTSASGTTIIYNIPNDIGYQIEIEKTWYSFNGRTGMVTENNYTGGDPQTGFVVQVVQRAHWVSTSQLVYDWRNYKDEFTIYKDHIVGATGQYESLQQISSWLTRIQEYDLPKYGYMLNEATNQYELVQYDYEFKEVGVVLGSDGKVWTKSAVQMNMDNDHRYRLHNFEAGQLQLIKNWQVYGSKASEVYFKVYSDWWYSAYNASKSSNGKYDIAEIIYNDIYGDTALTQAQRNERKSYWMDDGVDIKHIDGLGYVFVLRGTSNEWSGLVKGLPLLQANPGTNDGAKNDYGEVLYTAEEVGALLGTTTYKASDENWPYKTTYFRKTRSNTEQSVSSTDTFQIDNATESASYFKTVNENDVNSVTVTKKWLDIATNTDVTNQMTDAEVTVTLKRVTGTDDGGNEILANVTEDAEGNTINPVAKLDKDGWTYTWENIPEKDDNGDVITYRVVESNVKVGGRSFDADPQITENGNNFTITNKVKSILVQKRFQNGNNSGANWIKGYDESKAVGESVYVSKVYFKLYKMKTVDNKLVKDYAVNEYGERDDNKIFEITKDNTTTAINDFTTDDVKIITKGDTLTWVYTFSHLPAGVDYQPYEVDSDGSFEFKMDTTDGTMFCTEQEVNLSVMKNIMKEITAQKEWKDKDNNVSHPDITFELYKKVGNGDYVKVDSKVLSDSGEKNEAHAPDDDHNFPYVKWSNLPEYDYETGEKISYFVKEVCTSTAYKTSQNGNIATTKGPDGEGNEVDQQVIDEGKVKIADNDVATITFVNELETVDYGVTKNWAMGEEKEIPDGITATLYLYQVSSDGTKSTAPYRTVILNGVSEAKDASESVGTKGQPGYEDAKEAWDAAGNSEKAFEVTPWHAWFRDLPKFDAVGNAYTYQITEKEITGYTIAYRNQGASENSEYLSGSGDITNTPITTDVKAEKKWTDNQAHSDDTSYVTLYKYIEGEKIITVNVSNPTVLGNETIKVTVNGEEKTLSSDTPSVTFTVPEENTNYNVTYAPTGDITVTDGQSTAKAGDVINLTAVAPEPKTITVSLTNSTDFGDSDEITVALDGGTPQILNKDTSSVTFSVTGNGSHTLTYGTGNSADGLIVKADDGSSNPAASAAGGDSVSIKGVFNRKIKVQLTSDTINILGEGDVVKVYLDGGDERQLTKNQTSYEYTVTDGKNHTLSYDKGGNVKTVSGATSAKGGDTVYVSATVKSSGGGSGTPNATMNMSVVVDLTNAATDDSSSWSFNFWKFTVYHADADADWKKFGEVAWADDIQMNSGNHNTGPVNIDLPATDNEGNPISYIFEYGYAYGGNNTGFKLSSSSFNISTTTIYGNTYTVITAVPGSAMLTGVVNPTDVNSLSRMMATAKNAPRRAPSAPTYTTFSGELMDSSSNISIPDISKMTVVETHNGKGNWTKEWKNLPAYTEDGKKITYYVIETRVDTNTGYTTMTAVHNYTDTDDTRSVVINNTPGEEGKINVSASKVWKDSDGSAITDSNIVNGLQVKFGLYDGDNLVTVNGQDNPAIVTGNGTITWTGLDKDKTYTVKEVGVKLPGMTEFVDTTNANTYQDGAVAGNQTSGFTITNKLPDITFNLLKVDKANTSTVLKDAEFELWQIDKDNDKAVTKVTNTKNEAKTGADGKASISGLKAGYYMLQEMKAPDGYIMLGDGTVYFKVEAGVVTFLDYRENTAPKDWETIDLADNELMSFAAATNTLTVGNEAGKELPSTGGIGTTMFCVFGALLVAGSVSVLIARRRRRA